jgi:hypothetical protein
MSERESLEINLIAFHRNFENFPHFIIYQKMKIFIPHSSVSLTPIAREQFTTLLCSAVVGGIAAADARTSFLPDNEIVFA